MKFAALFVGIVLWACAEDRNADPALFSDITEQTSIDFENTLAPTERVNPYTYRSFYNGAGVAVGDINNDGLVDIYFAGNQVDNRLYLNQGSLKFQDITATAGVSCAGAWSTGVTMADVNGDGRLDIYVCKSGDPETPHRHNELFINNGDLTFTERSADYGLDVTGLSVQAAFFDYDKDGDLDCYLLTNSARSVGRYDLVVDQRTIADPNGEGNKFFVNENGTFLDYSAQAGIYRSNIGFGLGITLGDFNVDGWTDIFISNDFFERDYLYINNRHGGFIDSLTSYFQSISMGSMGADFADLNDDGNPELLVTEMLPDSLNRKKTKTVYEGWDKYQLDVQKGYYHQFPRNMLQTKIGDGAYVDIGRLAGVAASEWSWGALLFDMNNDGRRDIFIANGIYRDLLDRDYLSYSGTEENISRMIHEEANPIMKLIELMPSSPVPNYAFENEGGFRFKNVSQAWGLGEPVFSSGSAYADLDNDGDLDLIVNNINARATIYRNNTDTSQNKSLTLSLSSHGPNTFAIGSVATIYHDGVSASADNFVTRGFQSAVAPSIHFGLGAVRHKPDSIIIRWPDKGYTVLYDVPPGGQLRVVREEVRVNDGKAPDAAESKKRNRPALVRTGNTVFRHDGSGLIDFNRDRLLPMMYSNETPFLTKGDINGDGIDDIYVGGGKGQPGAFIQYRDTGFQASGRPAMEKYAISEETKSMLFDADGDGDLDLYMACGGRFFPKTSTALADRLFLNDGRGSFLESPKALPFGGFFSTSAVVPFDFDNDGDMDLLIGVRFDPFAYGLGGTAFLLENDGRGSFADVTASHASVLSGIGMVTAAMACDVDADGWTDVVLVGDWMPVTVLQNKAGSFENISDELGLANSNGWWHAIESADFNQDGKADFVIANHGRNTFFHEGDRMYVNDFDANGSVEQIFCTRFNGDDYPLIDKDELISQLPYLKKELVYYRDYGKKPLAALFPPATLAQSHLLEVKVLSSILLLSNGHGYDQVELPLEAQYSPLYGLLAEDFDGDGVADLLAGGNQYQVKPQFGRYDASAGWYFKGMLSAGRFSFDHGIDLGIKGQIRDIEAITVSDVKYLLFAKYDDELEIYRIRR